MTTPQQNQTKMQFIELESRVFGLSADGFLNFDGLMLGEVAFEKNMS